MRKQLSLNILGRPWRIHILDSAAFARAVKRHEVGAGTEAFTCCSPDCRIYFCADSLSADTVRHELTHAYVDGLPFFCQGIATQESMDEMVADLVGMYGPEICAQADAIIRQFRLADSRKRRKRAAP